MQEDLKKISPDSSGSKSREIKFRAWDNVRLFMTAWVTIWDIEEWFKWLHYWDPNVYIMQYTWFKDKNWVEIYGGDILSYRRTTDFMYKKSVVEFDYNVGAWYCWWDLLSSVLHEQNNDQRKKDANYTVKEEQYTIIIWNIYQNTELLSEK